MTVATDADTPHAETVGYIIVTRAALFEQRDGEVMAMPPEELCHAVLSAGVP